MVHRVQNIFTIMFNKYSILFGTILHFLFIFVGAHDSSHHIYKRNLAENIKEVDALEKNANYWNKNAQITLENQIRKVYNTGIAKNVIMFLGDGMSIPTLGASRTYLGQKNNHSGEEAQLSFEKFPFVGLSKTYCVDTQVADSACSATAYLCGVKANQGTIGVTAAVPRGDCNAMQKDETLVDSIGRWFQIASRPTGIVTTTRVTHASPAGVYAHVADRDWESDSNLTAEASACNDIATQLIRGETGKNLKVILGGGRREFIPNTEKDENGHVGYRSDGKNLIQEWMSTKSDETSQYVSTRDELLNITRETEFLLGLFDMDHIPYNLDRDPNETPSLAEMTYTAIKLLSKNSKGYFLFVEGGRIDHAHHATQAHKALDETVEFHKAVNVATELTNFKDTLIVVTSDHAHTMSYSGYPSRGNDILGLAGMGDDGVPYTTLSYANGKDLNSEEACGRHNPSMDDLHGTEYKFPALTPLTSETHGGDDVAIFARGPWAHLFTGVLEQNVIPHLMAYASCVGYGKTVCNRNLETKIN